MFAWRLIFPVRRRNWPGDPQRVWAETTATDGSLPPLEPVPPWRGGHFDGVVAVPASRLDDAATDAMLFGFGGVCAMAISFMWLILDGWRRAVILIVAAGCLLLGLCGLFLWRLARAKRESHVSGVRERAMVHGIAVHRRRTDLYWRYEWGSNESSGYDVCLDLLIDARLPAERIDHIRRASVAWTHRLPRRGKRIPAPGAMRRFGSRRTLVPLQDIFGPEAAGAWYFHGDGAIALWGVFMPAAGLGEFPRVLPISDPSFATRLRVPVIWP
jgi:hypothetical protein